MAQHPRQQPSSAPSSDGARPPRAVRPPQPRSGPQGRAGAAGPVPGGPPGRRPVRPQGTPADGSRPVEVPTTVVSGPDATAAAPVSSVTSATEETEQAGPKKKDLTVNKVVAGASAAAATAVFGSYFGAAGTVAGAAIGSVFTTLVTTLTQRSLDRGRDVVLQKVRPSDTTTVLAEPIDPLATIPLQRSASGSGVVEPVLPPKRPFLTRKRVLVAIGTTVVAFVVGLLAITGVEWLKGSPISGGDSGTSVGRVVTGTSTDTTDQQQTSDSGSDSGDGSTTTTTTEAPSGQRDEGSTEQSGDATPSRSGSTQAPSTSVQDAPQQRSGTGQGTSGTGGSEATG